MLKQIHRKKNEYIVVEWTNKKIEKKFWHTSSFTAMNCSSVKWPFQPWDQVEYVSSQLKEQTLISIRFTVFHTEWICSLIHSTKPLPPIPSASISIKAAKQQNYNCNNNKKNNRTVYAKAKTNWYYFLYWKWICTTNQRTKYCSILKWWKRIISGSQFQKT